MNKRILIFLVALNLLIGGGILFYVESSRPKTYYIDLQKVYNEFELKKELEKKLTAMVSITQEHLDSMELQARVINSTIQQNPSDKQMINQYNMLAEMYAAKSEEFSNQKQQVAKDYDDQIWGQLNEYIKQYGKENNCDFILGGTGDGSVMYSKESKDITDRIIKYVNEQYQGK